MEEEKTVATIAIGKLECTTVGNVITPVNKCVLITTEEQVWDITCNAFGCSPTNIQRLWDLKRTFFTKREL